MDQMVKPTPAPISARVTLPRVLLKNGPDAVGVPCACPPSLPRSFAEAAGEASPARAVVTSTWRLAGDSFVSCVPLVVAASLAAHGAAAAPSATLTHRANAAPRLNNRLT